MTISSFADTELRVAAANEWNLQRDEPGAQEKVPIFGSKYGIKINHAANVVVGDNGVINHNYGSAPGTQQQVDAQERPPQVDVLLVTVAEIEACTVLKVFQEKSDRPYQLEPRGNKTYYDLGVIGKARTFMVQSEQGTGGPSGSLLTIYESISVLAPSAVIMVGIAFGMKPAKQRIGDILISQKLQLYEHQRIGTNDNGKAVICPRGDRIQASPRLLDRFRVGLKQWPLSSQVHMGLMLSGEKLVDNLAFRRDLQKKEPEAIGGEMEGAGLYAAAHLAKTDWIVVKAISDWADGSKNENKDRYQSMAAHHAAQFVSHVLQQGGLARE